jgi:hypothetical protein
VVSYVESMFESKMILNKSTISKSHVLLERNGLDRITLISVSASYRHQYRAKRELASSAFC